MYGGGVGGGGVDSIQYIHDRDGQSSAKGVVYCVHISKVCLVFIFGLRMGNKLNDLYEFFKIFTNLLLCLLTIPTITIDIY